MLSEVSFTGREKIYLEAVLEKLILMQLFCFSVVPSNGSQFDLTTDNVYVDSALADERTGLNRQQDQPVCLSGNFSTGL